MPVKIDHIAIAVTDMDSALKFWRDALGLPFGGVEDVPAEDVAFLEARRKRKPR